MNIKEIKEILQLMADHQLSEIEIEKEGTKIKLKKVAEGKIMAEESGSPHPVVIPAALANQTAPSPVPTPPVQDETNFAFVRSPMVGTFYAAPAPDQPPYVTAGQRVKTGDVLCIIEAMKLMNEIKCEINGTIAEILVTNGQSVEFDQPLFKIQKGS